MTATGKAVAVAGGRGRSSISKRTWNLEVGQVEEVVRCAAVLNRPHDLRTVKSFSRARVVALEIVVQREGLAGLHGSNSVDAPPTLQLGKRPRRLGELVNEVPAKSLSNIEVGIASLQLRRQTVVRLRSIGNEVFQVAGIVDGVRPNVVCLG